MSLDGLPIMRWAPGVEGLYIATGHGGQGVMLGAGSGRLAAEMITGRTPFTDPRPFAVDRQI
jgi:D-amino-acid dehydrogenase